MSSQGSSPANPGPSDGFPSNAGILAFEKFITLNTKSPRPAIKDEEMSWCDGFMPIGINNLRTLYGVGDSLYTATGGNTIPWFNFWNIGTTPIAIVLLSDGSIQQVNANTGAVTQIAAAGTIIDPAISGIDTVSWGNQYIVICASQENGYFIWDGTLLYYTGTLAPGVTITDGGMSYSATPTIAASGGSGSGATFSATVVSGVITAITITNPGSGYLAGDTVTLNITDGTGTGAAAEVSLMPFGVSGSAIETYSGHVWVANGATIYFSAPGSVSDFATSSGGGNFTSTDSFLNVGYTFLKQSNGFLYLVADSSMSYISGVSTAGDPPTTTFQRQNIDPQIGTPWHGAVQLFSRNLVFGNALGVFASYGGAVTKISEPLDGIYTSVPDFAGFSPSSAIANIFGIEVYMQLTPIIDSYTGQQVNKLLMWSGQKWWTSSQDVDLTYIASQKINSVLTAWGTNGTSIYPLFQQPSTDIQKVAQSKLFANPHYLYTKTGLRVYGVVNFYQLDSESVTVNIDNETGQSPFPVSAVSSTMLWTNNSGGPIAWTNASSNTIIWLAAGTGSGLSVFGPEAVSQFGRMLGMTVVTNTADIAVISLSLMDQTWQANV